MKIGYFLASEEFSPRDLIEPAKRAEPAAVRAGTKVCFGPEQNAFFDRWAPAVLGRF